MTAWRAMSTAEAEARRRALANARPLTMATIHPLPANAPQPVSGLPDVALIRGDSMTPRPIRWLWHGWLAAGKFHILGGQPGTGKTTIALDLAATVSSGGRWPDGTCCQAGSVLIFSAEDDAQDVLVPRLQAMGADMSKSSAHGAHEVDLIRLLAEAELTPEEASSILQSLASQLRVIQGTEIEQRIAALEATANKGR
jgi:hypothetical protein